MKNSKLSFNSVLIFHQIISVSTFSFTLPKSPKEDTTISALDESLNQDIQDIFLGDQLTGRFGEGTSGYSGQSVEIDQNSDVLLQIIQGSAVLGDSPAPSDYNLNSLTQVNFILYNLFQNYFMTFKGNN